MFDTRNDLPLETRRAVIEMLDGQLAAAIDLERQAKQAHWNVKGPNFVSLHELFDRIAAEVRDHGDDIAERAVALGGVATGTIQVVARRSSLPEYPLDAAEWRTHVRAMQEALATFGQSARRSIDQAAALNDADTADLFTGISRAVDKALWMVEAHLQDGAREAPRSRT